jgi:chemotaxis-related protein WspB
MLHLLFSMGSDLFALPANEIEKVLPLPELQALTPAPEFVAGLLRYRGELIPVLDVNLLQGGTPCRRVVSTRIILVGSSRDSRLGLMVEQALEMLDLGEPQSLARELIRDSHGLLQPTVYDTALGLVRGIHWRALLTPELRALAGPETEGS